MALKYVAAIIIYSRLLHAASYSSVVFQKGGDVIPLDYYGAPLASLDPVLSLPSLPQLPSLSQLVSPCVSPCVIPPPVPVAPAARLVTNVPVVVKDDQKGYQYAYAVFDPNTGDKKTQSEVGDGSTVQGSYSFVQPDGVRREVSYTADDLKGFNAVVKNIVENVDSSPDNTDDKKPSPCDDGRSAKITELDADTTEATTDNNTETTTTTDSSTDSPATNGLISYSDILKCLQSKLQAQNSISPLTYILVPSIKKLC